MPKHLAFLFFSLFFLISTTSHAVTTVKYEVTHGASTLRGSAPVGERWEVLGSLKEGEVLVHGRLGKQTSQTYLLEFLLTDVAQSQVAGEFFIETLPEVDVGIHQANEGTLEETRIQAMITSQAEEKTTLKPEQTSN